MSRRAAEALPTIEIGRVERLVTLRSFAAWTAVSAPDVATLAEMTRAVRIPKGTEIYSAGEPVEDVYLVVRGELVLERDGRVIGHYRAGGGVGGLAAFARDREGYRGWAARDTIALHLRAEETEELFEERFTMLDAILRNLCRQALELRRGLGVDGGYPPAVPGEACPARPLDLVERTFFLRQNAGFGEGRLDALMALARAVREVRLEPGTRLWREGDDAPHTLAVVCGRVAASTAAGQRFLFGAGDFCGSLDSFARQPRWFDAEVVDGVVALEIGRDAMLDVLEDHPDLGTELVSVFAGSLLALLETAAARRAEAGPSTLAAAPVRDDGEPRPAP
jgi:CRP-like cAMP-binding protein